MTLKQRAFESIVGRVENAGNQHFLLFPQCFLPFPNQISNFHPPILLSANAFNLDQSKILSTGNGLKIFLVPECFQFLKEYRNMDGKLKLTE